MDYVGEILQKFILIHVYTNKLYSNSHPGTTYYFYVHEQGKS